MLKGIVSLGFLLFALPSFAATTTYKIDPSVSKVAWVGKKITGQHNGTIGVKSGKVEFEGEKMKGGEFVLDVQSITVLDLTDPKLNGDLTGHLKSDDFFSAEKFPEATFKAVKAAQKAGGVTELTGPLTIKGITVKEVTLPLKISKTGDKFVASGKAKLDRTKWDIKYRSGKFFPSLGDKLIHDQFELEFDLKGSKS